MLTKTCHQAVLTKICYQTNNAIVVPAQKRPQADKASIVLTKIGTSSRSQC